MSWESKEPWASRVEEWLLEARLGTLSAADREAFNELLRRDPAVRRYTRRILQNDVAISEELRATRVEHFFDSQEPMFPEPPVAERDYFSGSRLWAIAAALVAFMGIVAVWFPRSGQEQATGIERMSPGVAVLSRCIGAEWAEGAQAYRQGEVLSPGWLKLKSGMVQIAFLSGANVILEGPAELQLVSSVEGFCALGKVYGLVPAQARDFKLRSSVVGVHEPKGSFGLEVHRNGTTEVHALGGGLDVAVGELSERKALVQGSGFRVEQAGVVASVDIAPDKFLTAQGLEDRFIQGGMQRFALWKAGIQDAPPADLVLHYTFEKASGSELQNNGASRDGGTNGVIIGSQWAQGRWSEKAALDFKRVSDRVRIQVPGEFDAVTWMGWVRVDALPNALNALVLDGAANLHWQITGNGCLQLGAPGEGKGRERGLSPCIITPELFGQWLHLCSSFDGLNGKVCHYLNGQKVSESAVTKGIRLRVGSADIGNWTPRIAQASHAVRNFNGRIDELLLFSRALKPEEVRRHFEWGDPDYIAPLSSSIR
jgi:hypothetical protein